MKQKIFFTLVNLLYVLNFWSQPLPPSSTGGFVTNDSTGCAPIIVNFLSIIPNSVSWNWDFGNGNTSSLENPTEIYQNSGLFTVTLDVVYTDGTTQQFYKTDYIEAAPKPEAQINVNVISICENTNIFQFENNTLGTNQYLWDFGDGYLTTEFDPSHHYNSSGNYNVNMIVTNLYGCMDNAQISNLVVSPAETSEIQVSPQTVTCDSNFIFQFEATNSNLSNYLWLFSDSTQFQGIQVQKSFNSFGNKNVSLITTDLNNCLDTSSVNQIVQINNPSYDFNTSSINSCPGNTIEFTVSGANIANVSWDFGNGEQATGTSIPYIYQNTGTYTVIMTVTTTNGCVKTVTKNDFIQIFSPPVAAFETSDTIFCNGQSILFEHSSSNFQSVEWLFGDGNSSSLGTYNHTYSETGSYLSQLICHGLGCTDTISQNIYISQPNADFDNLSIHNCAPVDVLFTNLSTDASSYIWTFSNGLTSNDENPTITFLTIGGNNATLIAYDDYGCSDTMEVIDAVTIVNNAPTNFQHANFEGCSPLSLSLLNYTIGSGAWNWNFGDGTSSNQVTPNHIYTEAGEYVVSLETLDPFGCPQLIDTFAVVIVNKLNIDSLNIEMTCNSNYITATANCPDCESWIWSFGDGQISTGPSVSHSYPGSNAYYIAMTGFSAQGCAESSVYFVDLDNCVGEPVVGPVPPETDEAPPEWTESSVPPIDTVLGSEFCSPFTLSIPNPKPNAQSWIWSFGDGQTGTEQYPIHVYESIGTFSLQLIYVENGVTDTLYFHNFVKINGHVNDIIINSVDLCYDLDLEMESLNTNLLNYYWTINNVVQDNHTPYMDTLLASNNSVHLITLTTVDENYCNYSVSFAVVSSKMFPVIQFFDSICLSDTLIIEHGITSGYTLSWEYGDGSSSQTYFPAHQYTAPGNYAIELEITDNLGCPQIISVGEINVAGPNSNFTLSSPNDICIGDTIVITSSLTGNEAYTWSLTNANLISSGITVTAIAQDSGQIDVSLEVLSYGCYSENFQQAVASIHLPIAEFSFYQSSFCLPIGTQFADSSTNAVNWSWDFGDSTSSSLQNPSHNYSFLPNNNITLNITDQYGCTASKSKPAIDVFEVDFSTSNIFGCAPAPFTFTETSQNAINWNWDFGDGNVSNSQNPIHTYTNSGIFDVSLIVTSNDGCVDSITYPASVEVDQIIAGFTYTTGNGCAPQPAYFSDNSFNAVNWNWDFGNGFTSSQQNPIQIYYTGGTYPVQLIVSSNSGCVDTVVSASAISILGPEASFDLVDSIICINDSINFINNSENADSYTWIFGDGSSDTVVNPTHFYNNSGQYEIMLMVSDASGCQHFSASDININIVNLPSANFTVSDTIGCSPLSFSGIALSQGLEYKWLVNGLLMSTDSIYTDSLITGTNNIKLVVENWAGCIDSLDNLVLVHPVNNIQISTFSDICQTEDSVVVTTNFTPGIWFINGDTSLTNVLYIDSLGLGNHQVIYKLTDYCGGADTTAFQIDSLIEATINSVDSMCQYEAPVQLIATDSSGNWTGLGVTNPIGLFDPQFANIGNNSIIYTIDNGACTSTDSISILIRKTPDVSFSITSNQLCEGRPIDISSPQNNIDANYFWQFSNTTDTTISADITPTVYLNANDWNISLIVIMEGCSDTLILENVHVFDTVAPHTPQIIRSTVEDDESVLTEWEVPQYGFDKIEDFQVWRSEDSITFEYLSAESRNSTSFLDKDVDVHQNNYYYLIVPTNVCRVNPELQNMSSSILLKKEDINKDIITFHWSEYYKWKYGVDYYELQRLDESGNWITVEQIDGAINSITVEK